MGPNQTYKLLHSKGNHWQNEKAIYGIGTNICKWWDWQEANIQNIQRAHITQYKKTPNTPIKKWAEYLNIHFS